MFTKIKNSLSLKSRLFKGKSKSGLSSNFGLPAGKHKDLDDGGIKTRSHPCASTTGCATLISPLTPGIFEDDNQNYVDALLAFEKDEPIKNIALAGCYGSGKSSILKQFAREYYKGCRGARNKNAIKTISLSTFLETGSDTSCFITDRDTQPLSDEIQNEDETMKDRNTSIACSPNYDRSRLQSEIFKQIYFSVKPEDIPLTKYFRIGKHFRKQCYLFAAFLFTVFLGLCFNLDNVFTTSFDVSKCVALPVFVIVVAIMLYWLSVLVFHGTSLKVGTNELNIALSDSKLDFEQMLDEIIYIFKNAKFRVVVFEDLDRFRVPEIYEDLKHLNALINNSRDIKHKITFIYALDDSLISDVSDRTKLFDAIIPIAPIWTSETAADFISDEIKRVDKNLCLSNGTLEILAKWLPGVREAKTLANTYKIYLDTTSGNFGQQGSEGLLDNTHRKQILGVAVLRVLFPDEVQSYSTKTSCLSSIFNEATRIVENEKSNIASKISFREGIRNRIYLARDAIRKDLLKMKLFGVIEVNDSSRYPYTHNFDEYFKNDDAIDRILKQGLSVEIGNGKEKQQLTKEKIESGDFPSLKEYIRIKDLDKENYQKELGGLKGEFDKLERNVQIAKYIDRATIGNISFEDSKIVNLDQYKKRLHELLCDLAKHDLISDEYPFYLSKIKYSAISKAYRAFKSDMQQRRLRLKRGLVHVDIKEILSSLSASDYDNPALYCHEIFDYLLDHDKRLLKNIIRSAQLDKSDGSDKNNGMFTLFDSYCQDNTGAEKAKRIVSFAKELSTFNKVATLTRVLKNRSLNVPARNRCLEEIFKLLKDGNDIVFDQDNFDRELNKYIANEKDQHRLLIAAQIMCVNGYILDDISYLAYAEEALELIVSNKLFNVTNKNIKFLDDDKLIKIIQDKNFADYEMALLVSRYNDFPETCNFIIDSKKDLCKNKATCAAIYKLMTRNHDVCSYERVCRLIGGISDDEILYVALKNDISNKELILLLPELKGLPERIRCLEQYSGCKIELNNNQYKSAQALMDRLKTIEVICRYKTQGNKFTAYLRKSVDEVVNQIKSSSS